MAGDIESTECETRSAESAAELLATPAQYLKGVGPQRAHLLEKLGLQTARDILFCFPRDYQDMSELRAIGQLEENRMLSVCGHIEEIDMRNVGVDRSMLGVMVREGNQYVRAVWFNQPYMRERFSRGQKVLLSGKARLNGGRWEMAHPTVEHLGDDQQVPAGRILPIYSLTEGLSQWQMRRVVEGVLHSHTEAVEEVFPDDFLDKHNLSPIRAALSQIHFPADRSSLERARQRFVYQELLVLQLALALRRQVLTVDRRAPALPVTAKIDARIRRLLPFELTGGQQKSISELSVDLAREFPMNRLLQGDVGSGKTIVAVYTMLVAVAHGFQAAFMVPTEVLARQHETTLQRLLGAGRVRIGLLAGAVTAAQRRETLEQISTGQLNIVIGTQAILNSNVQFANLGLVVIDEQHKFGVRQRASLRGAGIDPHYLVMTATPIPRTVSMALFGDLDVSTLSDSPPGRQAVYTYQTDESRRSQWWEFFRKKLREGRQGYVISPRVEESESLEISSLEQLFEELTNGELEAFRLDLIHGRMSSDEKERAMSSFRQGATQVLVATSVVEVGVDVPNATLMTIEDGQRFGLAQLHQLRGRISRGSHPGYLAVFADPQTEDAARRLQAFADSNDGFELAETDFRLRGPGDLFGTRQHGLPPLRIADLIQDATVLEQARSDAQIMVAADFNLRDPGFARLRRMVIVRYGKALELGDVG